MIHREKNSVLREIVDTLGRNFCYQGSVGIVTTFVNKVIRFLEQRGGTERASADGKSQPDLPYEVAECFNAFCDGVEYISQKFGTRPKGIILTDEDSTSPRYNIKSGNVYVPRKFLESMVRAGACTQSKTGDEVLSPTAMATMYGVEEAFHHYQFTEHSDRYVPHLGDLATPDGSRDYDKNPIEADAKLEVIEALGEFKRMNPERFSSQLHVRSGASPSRRSARVL